MRTIHKYNFELAGFFTLHIPQYAKFLFFGQKNKDAVFSIWYEVDTERVKLKHNFAIVGTGHEVPEGYVYLASLIEGYYVWHLYREI